MTKDIIEAAKALIEWVKENKPAIECKYVTGNTLVSSHAPFKALEAALRPSREEIADYLRGVQEDNFHAKEDVEMFNYAIEELRRND